MKILEHISAVREVIRESEPNGKWRRALFRILVTCGICGLAFVIPRFAIFLNLIGGVAGASL